MQVDGRTARLVEDIVAANRILFAENVVDAFGHVSCRHPEETGRLLISRAIPPESVGAEDIMVVDLEGRVMGGDERKPYLERFIHCAIYAARPDVGAVVHSHGRSVIPFGVTGETLRPVMHSCATIGRHVPVWDARTRFGDTNMLVSDMAMGRDLAETLALNDAALMRGHGCTVVGRSIREAVYTAVHLEVNAGLQMQASRFPPIEFLSDGEVAIVRDRLANAEPGEGYDRAWASWCRHAGIRSRHREPGGV